MKVAYLVLLVTLIPTFTLFYRVRENIKAREEARFDRIVAQTQTAVENVVVRCIDQIYNMRALFAANQNVEPDVWKAYLNSMNVRHGELGILTLGYLEKVTPATKGEFLKRRSSDIETNFTIFPAGERPIYFPMVYVTQFDTNVHTIYGLDHAVRPERIGFIEQAVDQDKPFLTGRIKFMGRDGTVHTNSGTMVYLPVYKNSAPIGNVAQRRESLQGVIWMTIVPQQLLTVLFENQDNPEVDIEVFDGTEVNPDELIYDRDGTLQSGEPKLHGTITRRIIVPVLNRQWTVFFSTTPEFDANSPRYLQWLTLAGGLVFSFLLFGTAWMQAKARARAEQDAAALHKSEAALAVEKEELAVTLYSIGDGVITTDVNARIVSINKAAQHLTGWTQKEAEGKPSAEIFRIIHEQTRDPADSPVPTVLQTRAIVELGNHILLIARDGTERAIADSAAPICDKNGGVTGVVLVFRDVTEKQKAEAQMFKESKLESVGLLAGGIAHDFNNMLTLITGNIALARMPENSREETLQLLAHAERAALRTKDLTQQLLTFARGGAPIRKPAHLDGMIREACQFAVLGSNVQCEFSLAGDAWPVEIDEGQFRQILNNLVINTRQAMPDGGKVEVSLENMELADGLLPPLPAGKYVKLSIKDHGSGIKPEHLPKIFEPYFTTKKGGSGLGLATAYSVVRKHEGLIRVESAVGIGSTFQIYLPASNQPVAPPPAEEPQSRFSGHGRLLIMDDEAMVLKVLSAMLQKIGYEVETSLDGKEAIERFVTARNVGKPFKAVIMDLTIPNGMGGREAISRLRELDPDVKAIVSSGYSLDPIMANYREHGFCGVIPKPYRTEDLNRVLNEVIGN
jgi:PAS domain S-box-containing protein